MTMPVVVVEAVVVAGVVAVAVARDVVAVDGGGDDCWAHRCGMVMPVERRCCI